jgi:phosphatidylglycerophosphate synthase
MTDRAATDGERWAADALTALREDRFTGPAISHFLSASLERAASTRKRRRALVRQSRRWIITGTLATMVGRETANHRGKPVPTRGALIAWLTAVALMLDWHLGMVEGHDGEPREQLTLADALTLIRAAIAPFAQAAPPDARLYLLLLAVAGITDLADGRLARSRRGGTRFGRDFDSLADSAFRMAALKGARRQGWIGDSAHHALTLRQMLLAVHAIYCWFARSHRPPPAVSPTTRWHVPVLLAALATGARGHPRAATTLLHVAATAGTIEYLQGNDDKGPRP